jgi:hypothetical protein
MAHLNAALVEQFLDVPVAAKRPHGRCSGQEAQWEAVIEPDGVLDDGHRESVAVRLGVSHNGSAYPDAIKATQPREHQRCSRWRSKVSTVSTHTARSRGILCLWQHSQQRLP